MAKRKANKSQPLPEEPKQTVVDDEHAQLIEWVNSADDDTLEARNLAEKCRRYYDSIQWTPDEIAKLSKQSQAATVINRIKPKMDGLMGMERSNRTTAKAFPRTPKHARAATAATEAIRFVLDDQFFDQKRSAAWDNLLMEGTGGYEVMVEPKGDDFRIIINHILWDRIIYDPTSRRKDFSDARFLGQVVWLDYDVAAERYPDGRDVLDVMISGSQTYDDRPRWLDGSRQRVKVVELYYRKPDGDVYYACFTRGGYLKTPQKSPYMNEEGETEWPYEFGSLHVDRDGTRYGACRQLLDIQDEINKRRSKALHLMSVRQVRWERGAVEDINKARQELAKPDGVVETTPGMEFEVLKTGDMAAAQFNLLTEAKSEIDAVSYNAAAGGKENRNMSGVALRAREMAGQTEVAPMFDVLKHMDIRVYRKVWNRIRQYWKGEKWIRITDEQNDLKWVGLNRPMTRGEQMMQQAQEQGMHPQMMQQMQQQIAADPAMQQVVSTDNDIASLDVDIVMSDAPDTVTQQIEDFQVLGEMVKSGFPMPPIAVIEASPLSNKDRIIKLMKEGQQIPPELQEKMQMADEQMKKLAEENQKLKMDQQMDAAKLQQKQQEQQAEFALEVARQRHEQQLAREEFEFKKALQLEEAQFKAQMQATELAVTAKQAEEKMAFEKDSKMKEDAYKAQDTAIPMIQESLAQAFTGLQDSLNAIAQATQQNTQLLAQILQVTMNPPPRQVSIANIQRQRDASGQLIGLSAGVTPTIQ